MIFALPLSYFSFRKKGVIFSLCQKHAHLLAYVFFSSDSSTELTSTMSLDIWFMLYFSRCLSEPVFLTEIKYLKSSIFKNLTKIQVTFNTLKKELQNLVSMQFVVNSCPHLLSIYFQKIRQMKIQFSVTLRMLEPSDDLAFGKLLFHSVNLMPCCTNLTL